MTASNIAPTPPALLLIDLEGEVGQSFADAMESCGVKVHRVRGLDEAAQCHVQANPHLVALIDNGGELEPALEMLQQIKTNSPYRQTILITDRDDPHFVTECLTTHRVDHIVSRSGGGEALKPHLVAILRNSQLLSELVVSNHQLSRSSKTDSLTGLYNHGHIIEWLRIEHKRAQRDCEPLCVVMVDLDHFKFINDTYGHAFGDFVLSDMAELLKSNIRESDIIGRYGGEEFLILAPSTGMLGGQQLAEKLRQAIESHSFRDEVFDVHLTASFGLATTDHPQAGSADMLLQLADKALFDAKEKGRNCVVAAMSKSGGLAPTLRAEFDLQTGKGEGDKPQILVVDDSPLMQEMLGSIIRSMGLKALEAIDGEQALEIAKANLPACVLLDINMPGMDGYQICRQLRTIFRDIHIPVIFVTSEKGLDSQLQGYASGADDYITKPVIREHLIAKLQAQLRVKSLHDRLKIANGKLKQAQRTLMRSERLKAIGQMAAGVAHDFNNVLSSIMGHAQVIEKRCQGEEAPPEEIIRNLQAIESIAQDGAKTIQRLQFFAQPSRPTEDTSTIDVAEVINDCVQVTRTRWKDEADLRGIEIPIERNLEPGLQMRANPGDLREVITNLLLNAIDAMPRGGTLRLTCGRRAGETVLIEVSDTGVGMSAEVQRQAFDPFFTTKPESGAGLGLSVAYGIVTRMQGRIDCVSKINEGSTFRITLPLQTIPARPSVTPEPEEILPAPTSTPTNGSESGKDRTPPRILIVDDEPHIREVFSEILTEREVQVHTAADGEAALEHLRDHPVDLVLTDLGMPGISGWEVARRVKQMRPETKVVLTSGWGAAIAPDTAERNSIDAMLPKPVSLKSLLECVDSQLGLEPISVHASKTSRNP